MASSLGDSSNIGGQLLGLEEVNLADMKSRSSPSESSPWIPVIQKVFYLAKGARKLGIENFL